MKSPYVLSTWGNCWYMDWIWRIIHNGFFLIERTIYYILFAYMSLLLTILRILVWCVICCTTCSLSRAGKGNFRRVLIWHATPSWPDGHSDKQNAKQWSKSMLEEVLLSVPFLRWNQFENNKTKYFVAFLCLLGLRDCDTFSCNFCTILCGRILNPHLWFVLCFAGDCLWNLVGVTFSWFPTRAGVFSSRSVKKDGSTGRFWLLMCNHRIESNETWQAASNPRPLPSFHFSCWSTYTYGSFSLWLANTFLNLLCNRSINFNKIWQEAGVQCHLLVSRWCFLASQSAKKADWPLIGWHIFNFYAPAPPILGKLYRKHVFTSSDLFADGFLVSDTSQLGPLVISDLFKPSVYFGYWTLFRYP